MIIKFLTLLIFFIVRESKQITDANSPNKQQSNSHFLCSSSSHTNGTGKTRIIISRKECDCDGPTGSPGSKVICSYHNFNDGK